MVKRGKVLKDKKSNVTVWVEPILLTIMLGHSN